MKELRRPATQVVGHPYGTAPDRGPLPVRGGVAASRAVCGGLRQRGRAFARRGLGAAQRGVYAGPALALVWVPQGLPPPGTAPYLEGRSAEGDLGPCGRLVRMGWAGTTGGRARTWASAQRGCPPAPATRALRYTHPGWATQRRRHAEVRRGLYGHREQPVDVCSGGRRGRGCRRPLGRRSPRRAPPVTCQTVVHLGFCGSWRSITVGVRRNLRIAFLQDACHWRRPVLPLVWV